MKHVSAFTATALALVCSGFLANAQMSPEGARRALAGLTSVAFFLEPLDEEDKFCGITEPAIHDAFLYPVSSSRLRISRDLSGPTFYVQITTILQRQPPQCISMIKLQVFEFREVPLDFAHGATRKVALVLWNNERLRVTDLSRHAERIQAAVQGATEKFLTRWNLANRAEP